jgi:toxin ParE1/3/4
MTCRVTFSRRAQADLHELFDYLGDRFSIANAERFAAQIEKACLSLGTMPMRGTDRSDFRPGLRMIGFRRRVTIAFRVNGESVSILRILYGGQSSDVAFADDWDE